MQREDLCVQRIEVTIIVNNVVGSAQPFLPGNL